MRKRNRCGRAFVTRGGFALGFALAAFGAGAATGGWSNTASRAYPLANAVAVGVLPENQPLRIVLGLKLQNEGALDDFLARSRTPVTRDYGRSLSGAEFVAAYAPSLRQVQAVTDYLRRAGFSDIVVAPNRLLVSATAPAASVEAAFATQLMRFEYQGRTVYANTLDAKVPAALGGLVQAVLGLQNAEHPQPLLELPSAATPAATTAGHNPVAFAAIYDATSVAPGAGTDLGIVTDGDLTQTVADFQAFENQNGLSVPLHFVPAEVNGSDTSGTLEWDLDSQSAAGIAGGLRSITFYNAASLSDADLAMAYNDAVVANAVKAINVSLGICEKSEHTSGGMAVDDAIFKQAAAQGQTFFVSSGDGGSHTGCSGHGGLTVQVSYPASSPYVVAVGGTTLSTNGNAYAGETAWSGSGGGVSKYEPAPSWQQALTGSAARLVPDVAMDADPNSGALVINGGGTTQVGGTSLAAPLAAGTWTRAQSAHGNALGFAAPLIYAANGATPTPYHDVTSGSNAGLLGGLLGGCCSAGPGYDEVTGLGSFDIANFNAAVP
ncbi:MAG: S8/S53 family peptidase [Nevskia sp.]|nr:S8/S53 family peptidase [Nevskia sp.]